MEVTGVNESDNVKAVFKVLAESHRVSLRFINRIANEKNADTGRGDGRAANVSYVITPNLVNHYNHMHRVYRMVLSKATPDMCLSTGGFMCTDLGSLTAKFPMTGNTNRTKLSTIPVELDTRDIEKRDAVVAAALKLLDSIDVIEPDVSYTIRDDYIQNINTIQSSFVDTLASYKTRLSATLEKLYHTQKLLVTCKQSQENERDTLELVVTRGRLKEADQMVKDLEDSLTNERRTFEEWSKKLATANTEITRLKSQNHMLNQQRLLMESAGAGTSPGVEYNRMRDEFTELMDIQKVTHEQTLRDLSNKYHDDLQTERRKLDECKRTLAELHTATRQEIERLKNDATAQQDIERFKDDVMLRRDVERLKTVAASINSITDSGYSGKDQTIAELQDMLQSTSSQLSVKENEVIVTEQKLKMLRNELDMLTARMTITEKECGVKDQTIKSLRQELDTRMAVNENEYSAQKREQTIASLINESSVKDQTIANMRNESSVKDQTIANMRNESSVKDQKITDLRKELDSAVVKSSELLFAKDQIIESMKNELEVFASKMAIKESEYYGKDQFIESLRNEIETIRQQGMAVINDRDTVANRLSAQLAGEQGLRENQYTEALAMFENQKLQIIALNADLEALRLENQTLTKNLEQETLTRRLEQKSWANRIEHDKQIEKQFEESLQNMRTDYERETEQLREQIQENENEYTRTKNEMIDEVVELKKTSDQIKQANVVLKDKIRGMKEKSAVDRQAIENMRQKLIALQGGSENAEALHEEIRRLNMQLETQQNTYKGIEKKVNLAMEAAKLEDDNNKLKINKLQEALQVANEERRLSENLKKIDKETVDQWSAKCEVLAKKNADLSGQVEDLRQKFDSLSSENDDLRHKIDAQKSTIHGMKNRYRELAHNAAGPDKFDENNLIKANDRIITLEDENSTLRSQLQHRNETESIVPTGDVSLLTMEPERLEREATTLIHMTKEMPQRSALERAFKKFAILTIRRSEDTGVTEQFDDDIDLVVYTRLDSVVSEVKRNKNTTAEASTNTTFLRHFVNTIGAANVFGDLNEAQVEDLAKIIFDEFYIPVQNKQAYKRTIRGPFKSFVLSLLPAID